MRINLHISESFQVFLMNSNFKINIMKTTINIILISILSLVNASCEKKVDLKLKNVTPKLVVEGNVLFGLDTIIDQQEIKLSTTANYLGNSIPEPAINAVVRVQDGTNTYTYNHIGNGVYRCNFIASVNKTYKLIIFYDGDEYNATETLRQGGAIIKSLSVKYFPGSFGDPGGNFVILNTVDPIAEDNFYLWKLFINNKLMITATQGNVYRSMQKDEFFNGQPLIDYLPNDEFPVEEGDIAQIHQLNISEQMYNFYYSIFNLTSSSFVTGDVPPGNIKGNVINLSKPEKNALGYFGACSVSIKTKNI
jgi:hypothetical protein